MADTNETTADAAASTAVTALGLAGDGSPNLVRPPGTGQLSPVAIGFAVDQVGRLEPLDYLLLGVPRQPVRPVEAARTETGSLVVRVPPMPTGEPLPIPHRNRLAEMAFSSPDPANPALAWERGVADPAEAVELAATVLRDALGADLGDTVDLFHGSHRMEHERKARLEAVRQLILPVLTKLLGRAPEIDSDGDYVVPVGDIEVFVALRAGLDGMVIVRVLAISNVGVEIKPELGLFLARLNFGLMFGRFALDAERQAVWFDETLLGGHIDDVELQFTIGIVATTARSWDEQIKQMFGGMTRREARSNQATVVERSVKPGQAGYL